MSHPSLSMALFDCCKVEAGGGGVAPSAIACCCPCIPFGEIASRIPGARFGANACCCAYACADLSFGCGCLLQFLLRQKFHESALVEHEPCWVSCALGLCCSCCGMVQMQKQLHALAHAEPRADTQSFLPQGFMSSHADAQGFMPSYNSAVFPQHGPAPAAPPPPPPSSGAWALGAPDADNSMQG